MHKRCSHMGWCPFVRRCFLCSRLLFRFNSCDLPLSSRFIISIQWPMYEQTACLCWCIFFSCLFGRQPTIQLTIAYTNVARAEKAALQKRYSTCGTQSQTHVVEGSGVGFFLNVAEMPGLCCLPYIIIISILLVASFHHPQPLPSSSTSSSSFSSETLEHRVLSQTQNA